MAIGSQIVSIASGKVGSNLTGFPVYVDLALLPSTFWSNVQSDGRDIRVRNASGSLVPFDVVSINTGTSTGALFAKLDVPTTGTTFTVEFGDTSLSALPATDTNGRNAVWSDYEVFWHAFGGNINRKNGNSASVIGTINNGSGPTGWLTIARSGALSFTSITGSQTWTMGSRAQAADSAANNSITSYSTNTTNSGDRVGQLFRGTTTKHGFWNSSDSWMESAASFATSTQYSRHCYHNGTSGRGLYVDGTLAASAGSSAARPVSGANTFFIGGSDSSAVESINGALLYAYLRLSVLSADWIKAEHDNISAPGTFLAFPVTIAPAGIASGQAFGTPTITASGGGTISPTGIASAEAFGSPTVSAGPITLSPSGISSSEAFGTPTISSTWTISPTGIGSAEAFGSPTVTAGAVTISPSGIASGEAFGTPVLSSGGTILPSGIASAEAFGTPAISGGPITLQPSGIASAEAFGVPTISSSGAGSSVTQHSMFLMF